MPPRIQAQKMLMHSIYARNLNVSALSVPQHPEVVISDTMTNFLEKFCHPAAKHLLDYYNLPENKVQLNENNFKAWIEVQDFEKLSYLVKTEKSLCATKYDMQRFNLMIKPDGKVNPTMKDYFSILPSQTVVYSDRELNAVCSPLFIELRARIFSMIKPNVLINMKKNRQDIERFLNIYDKPGHKYNYVENDFEKYDKSQQSMALNLEWAFYQMLGMKEIEHDVWVKANEFNVVRSIQTGLTFKKIYQRNSGSVTTALGNTIVNILTISYAYRSIKVFVYAMFLGDDSIICVSCIIDCGEAAHLLSTVFNLSATTIQSEYGYFCSCFIIKTDTQVFFMSDALKRYKKLGTFTATSEEKLFDMYQSYCDIMFNYNNIFALQALSRAIQMRYELIGIDILTLLVSLYSITTSYEIYRDLFEETMTTV
jgi:hypothetical protein